jgi:hypothetical protein
MPSRRSTFAQRLRWPRSRLDAASVGPSGLSLRERGEARSGTPARGLNGRRGRADLTHLEASTPASALGAALRRGEEAAG